MNEELRNELLRLFGEDQALLAELEAAMAEASFGRAFDERKARIFDRHPPVFYALALYEDWAGECDAPELVHRYVSWRNATTDRLKAIVSEFGWPRASLVGDDAAFLVFSLFAHADTANDWRRTQLGAITEAFRAGEVAPRLYAHICDRIEACDGRPQIYGTVMGPGDEQGTARLYWPVVDTIEEVDARRARLGLPSNEEDLAEFRKGAVIGPYMTPTNVTQR